MYPASVGYLNRQRIIPNWGGGLWEQRYIYIFPFFSFCECVCVCFCVWFCLYSFAFTICPRFLSVRFYYFFYYLKIFFLNNYFLFFILITYLFILFYFIMSSFFLSFFPPFCSEPCGGQALGAPARHQGCATEEGEPTSGHWPTGDVPAPRNIKWQKSTRDLHLNAKTQLHSTTSKLQCWTPYAKQLARQEHNPIH